VTLFVSNFTQKLDAKGRVSIPASYRAMLQREQSGSLFCYPAPERAAFDAGGQALIEEMRRFIERFPEASVEREQFAAALYGTSETLKIDSEGRLVLPESLKIHAGIGNSVTFVGLGHKFQMWEPERFQMQLVQATARVRALRIATAAESA
jgi:MraZ protein